MIAADDLGYQAVRAQVLTALGYFEKFEKKKQFIIEVKQ